MTTTRPVLPRRQYQCVSHHHTLPFSPHSASCHDVGHPGLNNAFLTQSGHPLAITYNDESPLEQMHAATTFLIMRRRGEREGDERCVPLICTPFGGHVRH